jgi:hypothetical protein
MVPQPPAPGRYAGGRYSRNSNAGGFPLLFFATIAAAFLYLSGVANVTRHDVLYAALLAAVWCVYFLYDKLLGTRLGPVLMLVGRLLILVAAAGFFGGIYWLILTSG